ncbi:Alkyl hydroperoxide reductase subunit F [Dyadobacter sp. CECT 9275]|uniref:Alkyl hydroperoxide reductase subunit F n=1 Tax=Dyadobacter helix TaxID=2822344 RepID=A0A916J8S3_9BACT|nr:NAD(P)/FAD-dependent oxidoreductase [Dyadobacter sp. CECT 9275]CAG4994266.1 Alkyl hydroperoxide reductase subunit F [Dyadobacter sp. CECT 9275]
MVQFDVIIIGGSYAGLSAAMALGRSLRKVLVLDAGDPCNKNAPHSHNFLTRDGEVPGTISTIGLAQVLKYPTVEFQRQEVTSVVRTQSGIFEVATGTAVWQARKILFATGIRDIIPDIPGMQACVGISVIHCPYCHGYEVHSKPTAVLANGDMGFDYARMVFNWTKDLTLLTNGPANLTVENHEKLLSRGVKIEEAEVVEVLHTHGQVSGVRFKDGRELDTEVIYSRNPFVQKSSIPEHLGCEKEENGLLKVDDFQRTTVEGIYAAGDNCYPVRSVAGAVATGNKAGAFINHELIQEDF